MGWFCRKKKSFWHKVSVWKLIFACLEEDYLILGLQKAIKGQSGKLTHQWNIGKILKFQSHVMQRIQTTFSISFCKCFLSKATLLRKKDQLIPQAIWGLGPCSGTQKWNLSTNPRIWTSNPLITGCILTTHWEVFLNAKNILAAFTRLVMLTCLLRLNLERSES